MSNQKSNRESAAEEQVPAKYMKLLGRLCGGATIGLFLAAMASLLVTWIIDRNITDWIQYDKDEFMLEPVLVFGLAAEELHVYLCGGLVFVFSILFAVLQVKPRFPMLATERWFYITLPLTVIAVTLATYYFVTSQLSWMWLYQ